VLEGGSVHRIQPQIRYGGGRNSRGVHPLKKVRGSEAQQGESRGHRLTLSLLVLKGREAYGEKGSGEKKRRKERRTGHHLVTWVGKD